MCNSFLCIAVWIATHYFNSPDFNSEVCTALNISFLSQMGKISNIYGKPTSGYKKQAQPSWSIKYKFKIHSGAIPLLGPINVAQMCVESFGLYRTFPQTKY